MIHGKQSEPCRSRCRSFLARRKRTYCLPLSTLPRIAPFSRSIPWQGSDFSPTNINRMATIRYFHPRSHPSPPPLEPLQPRIPKNSRKLPLRRELSASIHVAENNDPDVLTFSRYLPCARRIAQRAETGGSRGDQLYASLDCFVPFERTPAADSCFGSTMGVVSSENVSLPARLDALLPLSAAVWGCLKSVRPKSGNRAAFESTILIKSL